MANKASPKLTQEESEAQVVSAVRLLDDDASWIKGSALLERAFYLGVIAGLRGLANEQSLAWLLTERLAKTAFGRKFDNTFPSTVMGNALATVDRSLHELASRGNPPHVTSTAVNDALRVIERATAHHAKEVMNAGHRIQVLADCMRDAMALSASLQPDDPRYGRAMDEQFGILRELEHWTRIVALLETDHNRWKELTL